MSYDYIILAYVYIVNSLFNSCLARFLNDLPISTPGRTYASKNSIFLQTHDLPFNSFLCNFYSIGHFLDGNGAIL